MTKYNLATFVFTLIFPILGIAEITNINDFEPENLENFNPNKKTVCSITINSDEEVNTFRKHLKDFNFLELIPKGQALENKKDKTHWFDKACKKGVQCDVLIISGHFGGKFFGKSQETLSTAFLEERSCDSKCSGILHKPKEVFLMGCNTLAGKKKDHRTMQEYMRVLMVDDGFSRREAEAVAAFRYSPVGSSMKNRMINIFSGVPKIYGFSSVGPSGKNVEGFLNEYLKDKNYTSHLKDIEKKGFLNKSLAKHMSITAFTSAKGATIGKSKNRPICILNDPNIDGKKKTAWMVKQLKNPKNRLKYIPHFKRLLDKRMRNHYKWSKVELAQIEQLKNDRKLLNDLDQLIRKPTPGMMNIQMDIVKLMKSLKVITSKKYALSARRLILPNLNQDIDSETKDSICSMDLQLNIPIEHLKKLSQSPNLISAIGCLKPRNTEAHKAVVKVLMDQDVDVRREAARALREFDSKDPQIHLALAEALKDQDVDVRRSAIFALGDTKSKNPQIHFALASTLKDTNLDIRSFAITALGKIKTNNPKVHQALAELLSKDNDNDLRRRAARLLSKININNPEVYKILLKDIKSNDSKVREFATRALLNSKINDARIHQALTEALKDKNKSVRINAAIALGKNSEVRRSPEVLQHLNRTLNDKDESVRAAAAYGVIRLKPSSKEAYQILDTPLKHMSWKLWGYDLPSLLKNLDSNSIAQKLYRGRGQITLETIPQQ